MGISQILAGSGSLALAALGVAMIWLDEFKAAYWLFWASGITATLNGLWYEFATPDSAPMRIGSGIAAGIGVFVVLPCCNGCCAAPTGALPTRAFRD
jgi:hypothetical protein